MWYRYSRRSFERKSGSIAMHDVRRLSSTIPLVFLAAVLIVVDRFFKAFVLIDQTLSVHIIPGVFHIEYSLNTNAAFSIAISKPLYATLCIAAIVILSALWVANKGMYVPLLRIAGVLLLIGTISNMWDRIVHGGVIDMLAVPGLGACNLADIYVVSGAVLWAFFLLRR
jgi:lipoprotein signal peptidase